MSAKAPLCHIVKRGETKAGYGLLVRFVGIALSLLVSGLVIMLLTGLNPVAVFTGIWDGAMGTEKRTWITLRDAAILLCIGFAVLPAFRMRFWNTGGEGQVLVGAAAPAAVLIYGKELPTWLLYSLCPVAGVLAGMVWGIIPALFKARWNTNETLFTLMMNYIATQLVAFLIVFWENPPGSNSVGLINMKGKIGWLPKVHLPFLPKASADYVLPVMIVLVLAVCMYVYMRYAKQGYEIAVVGESENTAKYAGINVKWVIIRTMALCGAMAGLAGYLLAAGVGHTISTGLVGGRGFTAIVVAWLGKLNPFIMAVVALFLVFMQKGSVQIASQFNMNENASEILTGIILFFVLGCEFFIRYRLVFFHHRKQDGKEGVKA